MPTLFTKLRTFLSLYREQGLRWSAFRVAYALRLRTGLIRWQLPQYAWDQRPLRTWLRSAALTERIGLPVTGFRLPDDVPWDRQAAVREADRVLGGELRYFAHQFHRSGFPPRWHGIPLTLPGGGAQAVEDPTRHWSQLSDDAGVDIKFIWEPSRFAFVYTLVRAYAATQDEKCPEAFWQAIADWAEHNPPNAGPNWMDGQEIALRLMAWIFGYQAFAASPASTPQRREQLIVRVAAQAERIYRNIGYARSTGSNHTISEAFGLWLVGLSFPALKDAEQYLSLGRQLLEQEAAAQLLPDGSYAMYSLNYHRFVLQLYLYALRLGDLYHAPLSTALQNAVSRSMDYLLTLIDPRTGHMPVYGSNDGALVLPLNNCDFTDYRPLLQLGWYLTKGERLFELGPWDEDVFWICGHVPPSPPGRRAGEEGASSFPHGGTYLLRGPNSHAVIRCTDFASRPSHADQLHVDLWLRGRNLALDAGTYLYSGQGSWRNGLAHTAVHNTVVVDGRDQMTQLSRFTWTDWARGRVLRHTADFWQGEHDGYRPIAHRRTVLSLADDRWLVLDRLEAAAAHRYTLHWLLADAPHEVQTSPVGYDVLLTWPEPDEPRGLIQLGADAGRIDFSVVRADPGSVRGWRSRYYADREPALSLQLEAEGAAVSFWTFFGEQGDVVRLHGNHLQVNGNSFPLDDLHP